MSGWSLAGASTERPANDDQMRKMADRIQARAIRRCNELLKQYPENSGKRHDYRSLEGSHEPASRRQAAHGAGMSDWQYRTTRDVGNVPEPDFNAAVESDNPPTVTKLAEEGKKRRVLDIGI